MNRSRLAESASRAPFPLKSSAMCLLLLGLGACASQSPREVQDAPSADTATPVATTTDTSGQTLTELEHQDGRDWHYPESSGTWGPACGVNPQTYQQSPIDFSKATPRAWAPPVSGPMSKVDQGQFMKEDQNVVFGNASWSQVIMGPGRTKDPPLLATTAFAMSNFHFHQPAEHLLSSGQTGLMEMHIKSKDLSGNVAVFAILMKPTTSTGTDPLLAPALPGIMKAITAPGQTAVDFSGIIRLFQVRNFYSYIGSTTTPECVPNIRWFVLAAPADVAKSQYDDLYYALVKAGMPQVGRGGNARSAHNILQNTTVYRATPNAPSAESSP